MLPAMGYGAAQIAEPGATIDAVPCQTVVFGTPIDLRRVLAIRQAVVRVPYAVEEAGPLSFEEILRDL